MLNGELQVFWQPSLQEGVLENNQHLRDPKSNKKNIFFSNWINRLEPTCHTVSSLYESASFPDKCFLLLTFNYTGSEGGIDVYACESLVQRDVCSEATGRWIMVLITITYLNQKVYLFICILRSLIIASQELLALYFYLMELHSSDKLLWRLFT